MVPTDSAHFDRFFVLATAGTGLLLAGALNLALGGRGRRAWLRVPATAALGAGAVAVLATLTRAELAARAAGILSALLVAAFLLGSEWLGRRAWAAVGLCRRPGLRWSLVALAGLLALVGSGVAFELEDAAIADQAMRDLDVLARAPSRPVHGTRAATDRGTPVVPKEAIDPRDPAILSDAEEKALRNAGLIGLVIRRGGPTDVSNCHGWVFTGGKFLLSPDDVELVLKENGYSEVAEPQPGDLVVYRQGGSVAHTAVVRYVAEGRPALVEGKWGGMGVFLHPADKSLYGPDYTFHRSGRGGHLLAGLGGSPAPSGSAPMAVAAE